MARRRSRRVVERDRRIGVRLSDDELAEVMTAAGRVGLTPTGYVAEAALAAARGTVPPAPSAARDAVAELARSQAALGRIGNNLNQVARAYNETGELPPEAERVMRLVADAVEANAEAIASVAAELPGRRPARAAVAAAGVGDE